MTSLLAETEFQLMPLTRFAPLPGAVAAGLVAMAARLTVQSDPFSDRAFEMDGVAKEADRLRAELLGLVDEDAEAFERVMAARRGGDSAEIQLAYAGAVEPARRTCADSLRVLELVAAVAERGHPHVAADAGVAAIFAEASLAAAALVVEFELGPVDGDDYRSACISEVQAARSRGSALRGDPG
ncbi:MAG TPA: cyclodeaminase/cyclohydrolase family protein [Gaiellaceae bacterium]|nr:cyclodeaminase/cyclohydrolase family protein [Gaiellaceae bacterium]